MKTVLRASLVALFALLLLAPQVFAQKAPSDAVDFYNRGLDRHAQGDLDGALADYDEAIRRDKAGKLHDAYNNRANIRLAKGDVAGAMADYDKVVQMRPRDFLGYYNRGVARLNNA